MVAFVYGAELAAVLCFVLVFERLGVSTVARGAIQSGLGASKTIRNEAASDQEKERAARAASIDLLRAFGSITVRSAVALGASLVPLVLFHAAGLARISAVSSLMLSWRGILVACAAAALVALREGARVSAAPNYSPLDRALHKLAFGSRAIQETAADIERLLLGERFRHVVVERPIFVTSLPRAGTTVVLEVLARVPGIATHTYRDMPFVLAPILWERLSRSFRKQSELRERAHGDGLAVGYDSPEAFEEILWRRFWPGKYGSQLIAPWSVEEEAAGFVEAFRDHMRKIIALRADGVAGARYASKNNGNVARIALLKRLFPDCIVLVPIRDPVGQAVSLLRQHIRFGELHRREPFGRQYMHDIGHFEFGALHRPINFPGVERVLPEYDPNSLDYWVAYWECAYRQVLSTRSSVVLMSYETLCAGGANIMTALARPLGIPASALVTALGDRMHAPREDAADAKVEDSALERRARAVHRELLDSCVTEP